MQPYPESWTSIITMFVLGCVPRQHSWAAQDLPPGEHHGDAGAEGVVVSAPSPQA
jgi:hypothetical protein